MKTLSLDQMRTYNFQFFNCAFTTTDPYYNFFFLLYQTGLRFNELANVAHWDYSQSGGIRIPLSKGSGIRLLDCYEYPYKEFRSEMEAYQWFIFVNETTASRLFNKYFPVKLYLSTGKSLTTYFWRHLYIKEAYDRGMTTHQIAFMMSEQSDTNIAGYGSSTILY